MPCEPPPGLRGSWEVQSTTNCELPVHTCECLHTLPIRVEVTCRYCTAPALPTLRLKQRQSPIGWRIFHLRHSGLVAKTTLRVFSWGCRYLHSKQSQLPQDKTQGGHVRRNPEEFQQIPSAYSLGWYFTKPRPYQGFPIRINFEATRDFKIPS